MSLSIRKRGILIGCILAACVLIAAFFLWRQLASTEEGRVARITQHGNLITEINLASVTEPYTLRIDGINGAYNIIEVRPGSIGVIEASCPDHICIQMGFIQDPFLPVTCLPNEVVIQIYPEP